MTTARLLRRTPFALALLLTACAQQPAPVAVPEAATAAVCRADETPVASRGIGGTGAAEQLADRGIGGTGAPIRTADRGIGGTGIVGVITGFASVCVNGYEVTYQPTDLVEIDGIAHPVTDLRLGQVATIEASATTGETDNTHGLVASRIVVRHVVAGPVEAASSDGTRLTIAGQVVVVGPATRGTLENPLGAWREVSGLRDLDGTIIANRIDPRLPGAVVVSGVLQRSGGVWRIGGLVLRDVAPGTIPGGRVFARGNYTANGLTRPTLTAAPSLPFGEAVQRFSIEAYVRGNPGGVVLGDDLTASLAQGVATPSDISALAVVDMQRSETGLEVRGIRGAGDTHAQGATGHATVAATPATGTPAAATPATAPTAAPSVAAVTATTAVATAVASAKGTSTATIPSPTKAVPSPAPAKAVPAKAVPAKAAPAKAAPVATAPVTAAPAKAAPMTTAPVTVAHPVTAPMKPSTPATVTAVATHPATTTTTAPAAPAARSATTGTPAASVSASAKSTATTATASASTTGKSATGANAPAAGATSAAAGKSGTAAAPASSTPATSSTTSSSRAASGTAAAKGATTSAGATGAGAKGASTSATASGSSSGGASGSSGHSSGTTGQK